MVTNAERGTKENPVVSRSASSRKADENSVAKYGPDLGGSMAGPSLRTARLYCRSPMPSQPLREVAADAGRVDQSASARPAAERGRAERNGCRLHLDALASERTQVAITYRYGDHRTGTTVDDFDMVQR